MHYEHIEEMNEMAGNHTSPRDRGRMNTLFDFLSRLTWKDPRQEESLSENRDDTENENEDGIVTVRPIELMLREEEDHGHETAEPNIIQRQTRRKGGNTNMGK